jgi:pimeloyl-ACP methyl ester carboxylesterase
VYHADIVRRRRAEIAQALQARRLRVSAELAAQLALVDGEPPVPPASLTRQPASQPSAPPWGAAVQNADAAVLDRSAGGQLVRFCRAPDGVRIAYAVVGDGPPLVRAAHWMTHVDYDWQSPVWRHWMEALSTGATLVRYDQRGNGLSDWDVENFAFEAMVGDLEAVVDAAGLDQFTILGVSQSCSIAVAYAVRHPHRVSRLILYGGFAKGWRRRGDRHQIATHEAMTTLMREGWGSDTPIFRELFTHSLMPGADQEQTAWFNELQRVTVSPENASRLHVAFGQIDVSALLPEVRVPVLVLHARGDMAVPFQSGREFATRIADARFVALDSENHILLAGEPAFAHFIQEVRGFCAEAIHR